MNVQTRAADRLRVQREPLARAVTDALYTERPHLLERYGESGRTRCLEDIRYNLEHLAPAVDFQQPRMFANYIAWVDDLLRARNVDSDDLTRSLELIERELSESFPQEESEAILPILRAGLETLVGGQTT